VAIYRALESERPDALFHDPFARRSPASAAARITEGKTFREPQRLVVRHAHGALRSLHHRRRRERRGHGGEPGRRPRRPAVPHDAASHLHWIEVDLPDLLAYKTEQLARETPRCLLERVALDLSNVDARRELFARLSARAKAAMVVSEGLVVYLASEEAVALAWTSPERRVQPVGARHGVAGAHGDDAEEHGQDLREAGAPFKFAPDEGPAFFERCGWTPVDVQSLLHNAARLKRLSGWMRMVALAARFEGPAAAIPVGRGVSLRKGPGVPGVQLRMIASASTPRRQNSAAASCVRRAGLTACAYFKLNVAFSSRPSAFVMRAM